MMTPYYQDNIAGIALYRGDCLEVMPQLSAQSIDAVITDIPYGTTACSWDAVIPFEMMWTNIKRLIKQRSAVVLFGSEPFSSRLRLSNIDWFKYDWVWDKSNGGGFLNANRQPLKRHELISVFSVAQNLYNPQKSPGKPYRCRSAAAGATTQDQSVAGWLTVNDGDRYPTSILDFSNQTGMHPTQKPLELMRYLVRTYTNPGDTVLDFTCGSGTTLEACLVEGRKCIGIERDTDEYGASLGYCDYAVARLRGERIKTIVTSDQSKVRIVQENLLA